MGWKIAVIGDRMEVQAAVNTTVNMPDSVKGFVANATAYYTEATVLNFKSEGHAKDGVILDCTISLEAELGEATQLPADPPSGEHVAGGPVEPEGQPKG
jgi:hypothetical protein